MPKPHPQELDQPHSHSPALASAVPAISVFSQSRSSNAKSVYKSGDLEVLVASDGHFILPTDRVINPDAPTAEREAVLHAAGQDGEHIQLANNVAVICQQSEVILVDAGAGPRHQPTAGKLSGNLRAAGIEPETVTKVVLTHGHPDHLWGILDASNDRLYPNASYIVSAVEWNVWRDPDVLHSLPATVPKEWIATGAKKHFARIADKVVSVQEGYEIVSGVRVVASPGHTPGHICVEVAGEDGLVITGDALTHVLVSFQYPSWKVPADQEADRAISTRLRLLDKLATDKQRIVAAHLAFPGTGFVERKDGAYRFVAS